MLKYLANIAFRVWAVPKSSGGLNFKRHAMYISLRDCFGREIESMGSALSISHSEHLIRYLSPLSKITCADYPEFNILDLPFADQCFDLVVADQVLEHVEGDPGLAIAECFRIIKPSGICLITTCFINPIHGAPSDYWRFTADGLRLLARTYASEAEVIVADGWGNMLVHPLYSLGLSDYCVRLGRNPLYRIASWNQPKWPIVTWVALRRKHDSI